MATASAAYTIDTQVPSSYYGKLLDFIHSQYLSPQKQRFSNLAKETTENRPRITYSIINQQGKPLLQVEIKCTDNVIVTITQLDPQVTSAEIEEARQDVVIATRMFEEKARKATWYFAWREGEQIVPEKVTLKEKSFNRLFLETQILLFVVFIVFGMGLFFVIYTFIPEWSWVAPLALISIQFIFVFYSNKIIARTADWTITSKNPAIHFLEYHLPIANLASIEELKQTAPEQLAAIKKEVYEEVLSKRGAIDCSEAHKIFKKYNVPCREESLTAKKIDVYALVKRVADKFGYKTPKIVISNTLVPNAAASGPSPNRGVVLLTTGLLVQLDEPEVESVLGHELGHLKGRDPLILYGLTSAEFIFRFYVLFTLFPQVFLSFLFLIYFWAVMTFIFFIAKFFEARADLVSAMIIGKPKVLAKALEKIGFQRLLFERTPSFRLQEWIGLDSHPPIYFRVERLQELEEPVKIRHPLIRSMREVVRGFIASL